MEDTSSPSSASASAQPHVRRAVVIGSVVDIHKGESASLADAVDGIESGVILVDDAGKIGFANVAAKYLLSDGSIVGEVCARQIFGS